jgi:transposase InsO family protein
MAACNVAALRMAISAQRPGAGLIHHSDRGVQYAAAENRKLLQSASAPSSGKCATFALLFDAQVATRR